MNSYTLITEQVLFSRTLQGAGDSVTPSRTIRDSTGTNRAVIVRAINDEVILL